MEATYHEFIRLGDSYSVDDKSVTFSFGQTAISPYALGVVSITFTYDELKLFVKKNSPLWYLFE